MMARVATPSPVARQVLARLHPRRAVLVGGALAGAGVLLVLGLSLPILHTQQLIFWQETYSVWTGIQDLWKLGERTLAIVVFFFSMVFPFLKLGALAYLWCWPLRANQRLRVLYWLGLLGKWSMMDVFVVALLIVLVKVGSLARIEPRIGVYLFGGAILSSMLITTYVDRLARASLPGASDGSTSHD